MMALIQQIDNNLLLWIKNNMHNPVLDKVMVFLTSIGNLGLVWILISLLLLASNKYRKIGFMALGALLLTTICGELIIKNTVQRLRPSADIAQIDLLVKKPVSFSFPSGHTGSAFAAAGVLAYYFKRYALGIYCFAALIAFSRLYVNVHYPTDVLAGAILGFTCSRIVTHMLNKKETSCV